MFRLTRTRAAVGGTLAVFALAGGVAAAQAAQHQAPQTNPAAPAAPAAAPAPSVAPTNGVSAEGIEFFTEGIVAAPGAELDLYADCGLDASGVVVTEAKVGGLADGQMSPGADNPFLYGAVTLPDTFKEPAALTLTCANGATATMIITPGDSVASASGLVPTGGELESEWMADDAG